MKKQNKMEIVRTLCTNLCSEMSGRILLQLSIQSILLELSYTVAFFLYIY